MGCQDAQVQMRSAMILNALPLDMDYHLLIRFFKYDAAAITLPPQGWHQLGTWLVYRAHTLSDEHRMTSLREGFGTPMDVLYALYFFMSTI